MSVSVGLDLTGYEKCLVSPNMYTLCTDCH